MNARRWIVTLGTLSCVGTRPALGAAGDLDPTFADAGRIRLGLETVHRNELWGIATQADGKLVAVGDCIAGTSTEFVLFRYNLDGSLDESFGFHGRVLTSFDWNGEGASAVTIQPDGKILAAGSGNNRMLVARYLPDGSLDPTWGGDGRVIVTWAPGLQAFAMALAPNGKVVVAGRQNNSPGPDQFAVARFNSDGYPDMSFDVDGYAVTSFPGNALASGVVIQRDGKIVAVGRAELFDDHDHVALVRYLDNGALDTSFNLDGISTVLEDGDGWDAVLQLGTIPQFDKIVVAGNNAFEGCLWRFNMDGSLDLSFGNMNGKATAPGFDDLVAVRILSSGATPTRLVATGTTYPNEVGVVQFNLSGVWDTGFGGGDGIVATAPSPNGGAATALTLLPSGQIALAGYAKVAVSNWEFLVVKYNADGSLDTSFDGDGIRIHDEGGVVCYANDAVVQSDGKLVCAGATKSLAGDYEFAVVRCNPDGSFDPSFSQDGRVITPIGIGDDILNDVAIQPDGKIVVAGESRSGSDTEVVLARYNLDGSLDTTFSGDGILISPGGPQADQARAVVVQPDGRIVVAGYSAVSGVPSLAVLRFLPDGTPDYALRSALGGLGAAANAIALQPDGKVVVTGAGFIDTVTVIVTVRLLPNGTLDPSFDGDGTAVTQVGSIYAIAQAITVLPDGRIVVVGSYQTGGFYDVAVVRYNADGSLDMTFDGDGKATYNWGAENDHGYGVATQPNGKIVVTGATSVQQYSDFALLRLLDDGSLDPSYGGGGKVVVDLDGRSPDFGWGMAMGPDGKAVVVGDAGGLIGIVRVLGDEPTSVVGDDFEAAAASCRVGLPWPNPARGGASLAFHLAAPGAVGVTIFDVSGRLVRTLARERRFEPGGHSIFWDGRDDAGVSVASGVYVLRARGGGQVQTRRITVVR